jgi:hypothetical protein
LEDEEEEEDDDDEEEEDEEEEEDDDDDELLDEDVDDDIVLVTEDSSAIANARPSGNTFATAGIAAIASSFFTSSLRSIPDPPRSDYAHRVKTIPLGPPRDQSMRVGERQHVSAA